MSSYSLLQSNSSNKATMYGHEDSSIHGCAWNYGQNSYSHELDEFNPLMDEHLWSQLPEDLVDRILAWLPVASFLRLRRVCRKWSTIMHLPSFLEVCASVPTTNPYFIKISNCEYSRLLSSYNPMLNKWHNIPIGFLPSHVGFPVASAGGLLCFINKFHGYVDDFCSLYMCNPLSKNWKELPAMPCKQRPILVSMVAERLPFKYQIIVAGLLTTEVYDSISGSWRRVGCLPRGEEVSRNIAFCNGNLYCLTPRWYNCTLLAYNLQQEVWAKVKTGRLPGYCQFRNLVGCKGSIVIVGKSVRHQVLCVCIWLLEQKTMKWREVGRMPQQMSDHFLGRPSESFYCTAHGDLIFLTRDNCEMGLLFDILQKSWRWVSGCPNLEGFAFEPRLDAIV